MTRSLITIVLMIAFGAAAVTSNYIAMVMYWWYALFRPHNFMWLDISAFRIPLLVAILFVVRTLATGHWPRFDTAAERLVALFAILALISQVVTSCQSIYALTYSHVLVLAIVILLTSRLLDSYARIAGLTLFMCIFVGILLAALGITTALSSGSLYDVRIGSGGSNGAAMVSAMATLLLLPFVPILWHNSESMLFPWMRGKIMRRVLLGLVLYMILGLVALVYVSDSRGSAIALAVGGFVWMCLQRRRITWLAGTALAITMAFSLNLVPEAYVARIGSAFAEEEERDNSAESRPHFWSVALAMADKRPVGVGVGCYMIQYEYFDPSEGRFGRLRSAHSSHFNIAAELGYVGAATWLLLHAVTLHALWRVRRIGLRRSAGLDDAPERLLPSLASGLFASHVTFLVGGVFYEFSYNDITWVVFVIAGALLRLAKQPETLSVTERHGTRFDSAQALHRAGSR